MGNSSSQSVFASIDQSVNANAKIIQNCRTQQTQNQCIDYSNIDNSLVIQNNTINQKMKSKGTCRQNAEVRQKIKQMIKSLMKQTSEQLNAGLFSGPNNSNKSATEFLRNSASISSRVVNNCTSKFTQSSCMNFNNISGSILINNNSWNQNLNGVSKCAQKSSIHQKISQTSISKISQSSKQFSIGLFAIIAVVVALVVGAGILLIVVTQSASKFQSEVSNKEKDNDNNNSEPSENLTNNLNSSDISEMAEVA